MGLLIGIATAFVAIAMLLAVVHLIRSSTLADCALAIDVLGTQAVALVALYAMSERIPRVLEVAVPLAGLGLLGAVALSRVAERRAERGEE